MSSARATSLLEKSEPIQLWPIIDDGILITRFTFGENDHMLTAAGGLLLSKTNNFSPSDGYLAAKLDEIFGGRLGNYLSNSLLGGFVEYAGHLPARVSHEVTACGIRGIDCDSSSFQRQAIDSREVAGPVD